MPARLAVPVDARVFLGRLTRLDPDAVVRLRPAGPGRIALWARLPWGVLVTREVAEPGYPADPGAEPGDLGAEPGQPGDVGAAEPGQPGDVGAAEPGQAGDPGAEPGQHGDLTVGAAALLAAGDPAGRDGLARRDREWRWPLPPHAGEMLEEIPARRVAEVAAAAARTLREVAQGGLAGRPVGSRMVREALLDHVAIVVEPGDPNREPVERRGAGGDRRRDQRHRGRAVEVPQRLVQGVVRMGFLGRVTDPGSLVRVRRAAGWVGLSARYGTGWLPPPSGALTVRPVQPARP